MVSSGGSDMPSTDRSCTIQHDTSRTRTSLTSCPKLLEAGTEDVDDGRDAVASTASVACIFTTGPCTRPLLDPSLHVSSRSTRAPVHVRIQWYAPARRSSLPLPTSGITYPRNQAA